MINVTLPEGLQTSYKKQIVFQQEMSGTADIITEDLRLIERLLYQFKDILNDNNNTSYMAIGTHYTNGKMEAG
jgi:hypothetical protein